LKKVFGILAIGFVLACPAILPSFSSADAASDPDQQLQIWTPVIFNAKVHKRGLLTFEVQPRTILAETGPRNPNNLNLLIIRPLAGIQLTKNVSFWQGYGWTPAFNPEFRNEHRLFQQLLVENKFKVLDRPFTMSNRTRFEQRFIEDAGRTSLRARHRLLFSVPLASIFKGDSSKGADNDDKEFNKTLTAPGPVAAPQADNVTVDDYKWFLLAHNELFVNLNNTPGGPQAGIDQNRAFIGLNRRVNPFFNIEAGYLHNYVNNLAPANDRINHAILVGINVNVN